MCHQALSETPHRRWRREDDDVDVEVVQMESSDGGLRAVRASGKGPQDESRISSARSCPPVSYQRVPPGNDPWMQVGVGQMQPR